jgi:LAGLIDADG DNA endonuclease family protein
MGVGKSRKISEPSLDSNYSLSGCPVRDRTPSKLLSGYLAGLIEGDGSIIVPKTIRNPKGKLLYPVVKITFVEKDTPLALKIKEVIGGGTIVHPKNSNYIDLLFQDVNSIQKIAVLLNGKMRTPKIEALHRLID